MAEPDFSVTRSLTRWPYKPGKFGQFERARIHTRAWVVTDALGLPPNYFVSEATWASVSCVNGLPSCALTQLAIDGV